MTAPVRQGGASVHARDRIPSTDLSSLLAFLAEAYPVENRPDAARSWPVLAYDGSSKRLSLNTYGVLRRLLANKALRAAFAHSDDTGFLRDFGGIPKRVTIKMGGKILETDVGGVAHGTRELKRLVAADLDQLGITQENMLVADPGAAMAQLADKVLLRDKLDPRQATLVPMEFASPSRPSTARDRDVARVISAIEEIQGEDWLARLAGSTTESMAKRDDEFDAVKQEILLETMRQEFEKPDSQITRFLNFLEDDALARARLYVSFAIMEAVARQDNAEDGFQDLCTYVQRVTAIFDLYGAPDAREALNINLAADYGMDADFSLVDELVRARFYGCLPVWAEWKAQLLESRGLGARSTGVSVFRDVSYRFRINGRDPISGKSAFDSRRDRLRRVLLGDPELAASNSFQRRRCLAQVIVLWLALNPSLDAPTLDEAAKQLARRLELEGKAGVAGLFDDLEAWSGRVKKIGSTLVALLRSRSPSILSLAQRATRDLYLVVQESIVNWDAIGSRGGRLSEPLRKPDAGRSENVEWFKYVKVASRPDAVPEPLFSVRIVTNLRERILATRESETVTVATRREYPSAMLNVVWQPVAVSPTPVQTMTFRTSIDPSWRMGPGVDILFDPGLLTPHPGSGSTFNELDRQQYRAAASAAFTVLVYVVLQVLAERLATSRAGHIPMLMLRFQTHGREAAPTDGDQIVYAAAQAVEAALMRDLHVKMQGMVCLPNDPARQYKEMGTAFALSSAFPLVMSLHPSPPDSRGATTVSGTAGTSSAAAPALSKVALIAYYTRPCDEHPQYPHADGYVFRAKTYLADAVTGKPAAFRLSFDRMLSQVVESRDEFTSPTLIVEEVSRLHGLGYNHILLLSSHFGTRSINRSAQRHSPHTRTAFLDEISGKFPDVMLYMLYREVFPATRLHLRTRNRESGFEALRLVDHQEFAIDPADTLLKQLLPIYTFATLSIVGTDEASRPQSGFCTYFLDTDYQVRNVEWREQARANLVGVNSGARASLIAVLRGLHFLEAELQPERALCRAVLDPFAWISPDTSETAGEFQAVGNVHGRPNGRVLLSLPALLSHVMDALHGRDNS